MKKVLMIAAVLGAMAMLAPKVHAEHGNSRNGNFGRSSQSSYGNRFTPNRGYGNRFISNRSYGNYGSHSGQNHRRYNNQPYGRSCGTPWSGYSRNRYSSWNRY